jgi:hypothetical protein
MILGYIVKNSKSLNMALAIFYKEKHKYANNNGKNKYDMIYSKYSRR